MTTLGQAGARVLGIGRGQSHRAHHADHPVTCQEWSRREFSGSRLTGLARSPCPPSGWGHRPGCP